MTDQESSPVPVKSRRAATEGFVIVVSILLAFAIDAWWDSAQDRRDEQAVLGAIRQNLEDTASEVERVLGATGERLTRRARFLESSPSELAALAPDSAMWFLEGFVAATTLQPVDAAIRREDVVRLSDTAIRFAVSAWLGQVDDVLEDIPLVHQTLQALEEAMPVEALATAMARPALVATPANELLASLRRNERVVNAVLRKDQVEVVDSFKLRRLRDHTRDLLRALQR